VSFVDQRRKLCQQCKLSEWTDDKGICLPTAEKHGRDKADIEHGILRPELSCPMGDWNAFKATCNRCGRPKQDLSPKHGVCKWCVIKYKLDAGESLKQTSRSVDLPQAKRSRGAVQRGSAFRETGEPQWVSLRQLAHDVQLLASALPSDITAIVGVARSGITPASMVASLLHLPLLSIRQTLNDVIEVGNGWRLGGSSHIEATRDGKVAIIDDTVMTGNSLRAIAALVKQRFPRSVTAAVYVNPLAKRKPDIWVHDLGWPHILEWNVFNSVLSPNVAVDFDGILCHDCPHGSDDDGERYLDFIRYAKPLYVPRKVPIPLIVTARIEKYRAETEAWLRRHRINFHKLVMHPAATLAERNRDDIAAYKAKHFEEWAKSHRALPPPLMFIESDDWQARRISQLTGRMTVCPATESIYPHGLHYDVSPEQIKGSEPRLVTIKYDGSDPVPDPKSDKLIIVVSGGDRCDEQMAMTEPLMRAYAERCGADFVVLRGDQVPEWGMGNKYRAHPFIQAYQRTLFLDVDVIVKPDAPSIFEHVPVGRFAAWDEYPHVKHNLAGDWIQRESDEYCHSQGVATVKRTTMVNGGIMLFDRIHADSYAPPTEPIPDHWCSDQHRVTVWMQNKGIEPYWLSDQWHHSYVTPHFWDRDRLEKAHFIHVNGSRPHAYRIQLMQRLIAGNYDRIDTPGADYMPVRE
jgi:adenine/guanine phosphoribosyltransferase-like PRPP-binding protein